MKIILAILLLPLVSFAQNLFDSEQTLKVKITAPFQSLFDKRSDPKLFAPAHSIDGVVEVFNEFQNQSETYQVQIFMRGNMTLNECDFPKLKLKFKKEETTKKRLFNRKSYDLATHCLNHPESYEDLKKNMLSGSPHRESFALDLQSDLGLVSVLTRNAVIDYVDTSNPERIVTNANRDAFFMESTGSLIKRTGALYSVIGVTDVSKKLLVSGPDDNDVPPQRLYEYADKHPEVNIQEVLKFFLLQNLIGNMDYFVKVKNSSEKQQLWNVKAIALNKTRWALYGNDFNLAMMVTNEEFQLDRFNGATYAARKYFSEAADSQDQRAVIEFYLMQKNKLYAKAETIKNDPSFKVKYLLCLDRFYALLQSDY